MIPIVSIVGKSDSGKTTLIEKLLRELKARGYRVATVKHDVHGFNIDQPGKDTWRHAQAGADVVVISSPARMAMIRKVDKEVPLDEIAGLIDGVDLIITEGYKRADKPKIEVFRSVVSSEPLCSAGDNLLALASDVEMDIGVPRFHLDDAEGIAGFIEERVLKRGGIREGRRHGS